jgi:nucleoside-diphosphate-sugar epimerase
MRYNPEQLVILDVNENYLFQTFDEASSATRAKLAIVADSIVDQERMEMVFSRFQPQIVFHAAGYKNRLIAENCAESAVRNNILGTDSVLGAAGRNRTELFVHLSSDQAKEIKTVLGMIKRVEEMSVQTRSSGGTMRSISVRFGNILGAYGGVVSRLNTQIEHGGPVKIYDPDAQRSFISVKAAAFGMLRAAGEAWEKKDEAFALFTLDMGWPIRIRSLAEMLIRLRGFEPGKDIAIALPEGYAKTQGAPETAQPDTDALPEKVKRDKIVRVPFAPIDMDLLRANVGLMRLTLHERSSEEICGMLREIVGKAPEEASKEVPGKVRGESPEEAPDPSDPGISPATANA